MPPTKGDGMASTYDPEDTVDRYHRPDDFYQGRVEKLRKLRELHAPAFQSIRQHLFIDRDWPSISEVTDEQG